MALNPSYASGWLWSGLLNLYAGRTERAIERVETSLRLDPRGSRGRRFAFIGIAHFFDRRLEEALEKFLSASEELPSLILTHRFLAACYAHKGRLREAHQVVERLRTMTPAVLESAEIAARFPRAPRAVSLGPAPRAWQGGAMSLG
jgi:adenylate cyclase